MGGPSETHAESPPTGAEARGRPPLAERMRPTALEDFVGQEHLLVKDKPLHRLIQSRRPPSMVLWGPPGSGKTTLALIIARLLETQIISFSACLTGIKEVREAMSDAAFFREKTGNRTIIFIDEIHRFNKAQQDAFLPFVEKGQILLIGTTTVNPSFDLNPALLSRLKVFSLRSLSPGDVERILHRAVGDPENGVGDPRLSLSPEILIKIARFSDGDARQALNLLEELCAFAESRSDGAAPIVPTDDDLREVLHRKVLRYDKDGEEHYNLLSALHKSMRNSDPDATVYWVVRMLEGGEDPRNICRRIIQCASEDIGLADAQALHLAVRAWQAYEFLGLPEGRLAIVQAAVYNALAPKSNTILSAYLAAAKDVAESFQEPVPFHLRNAPTALMRAEGFGDGYLYAHDYPEGTTDMPCLPESLSGRSYYLPSNAGTESRIAEKLREIRQRKEQFTLNRPKRRR
ncbi:MAG: replication-associated recombination protein A [Acidobacteria bacterium]|nr:replication-associated recombination protein A [Acidobacteriota bacterium]